jgi:hypothetical protein
MLHVPTYLLVRSSLNKARQLLQKQRIQIMNLLHFASHPHWGRFGPSMLAIETNPIRGN